MTAAKTASAPSARGKFPARGRLPAPAGYPARGGFSARGAGMALAGLLLALWFVLPLVPVALWSVAGRWSAPAVLPEQFGLAGWNALISTGALEAFGVSAALGLAVAALATPAGLLAALALQRLGTGARRVLEVVLLAPLALPPFALVMGMNVLLLRAYIPGFAGVVLLLTVAALPYTAFLYRAALAGYDARYEEAARTLGATRRQVVRRVRLPMLAAATAGAAFLAFLVGWNDYIVTLIVGGGQLTTAPILIGAAASATGNEQMVAALSLTAVVPPLVLLAGLALAGRRSGPV